MQDIRIDVAGLGKSYGQVNALTEVDLWVGPAMVLGVLGHNGAGKTTLIDILATRVQPTAGYARVCGWDVVRFGHHVRRHIGMTGQFVGLDDAASGRANLILHTRLWGIPRERARERIDALIDVMGLGDVIDRPTRTYSGGQRRRLEIARAVVGDPRVLFLDEPTVGLDPTIRHELWALLRRLRERQEMTLVLTTHYLEEAERLCERIAIMHEGRIVAMDSPQRLLAALGDEILEVEANGTSSAVTEALRDQGIPTEDVVQIGSLLTIPLRDGHADAATRTLRASALPIRSVALRRPTLDDVYLRLTGAKLDA